MATSKAAPVSFVAFLEDPNDIQVTQETASALGLPEGEVIKGGIKEAIDMFSHKGSPQYLIVDISKSDLPVSDLGRLLEVCEPGIGIIAVGTKNDVGLYRDLIRLGIFEYIVSPLFSEILGRALNSMIFKEQAKKNLNTVGKLIVVTGSRGGVGSTFILENLATMLSSERSRRVIAVDLDLHFGTVSLYLNLKKSRGFREAIENPESVDQLFIERLLMPVNERFFVLDSEEPLEDPVKFKTNSIENILNQLSKLCHFVFIDVPHVSNNVTQLVISKASVMVLVTDSSLAGLRDARKLIHLFGSEGTGRRVITVMNKHGEYKENELSVSEFEESLKHKVDHVIPYDSIEPIKCINEGKTLANQDTPLAKSVRDIVDDLFGSRKVEEKKGGFASFWKKLKLN